MAHNTLSYFMNILMVAGGVFALYGVYFLVVALFGFKKGKAAPAAAPKTRFAVVVAARNEEAVIGQLVDSLLAQNYPDELYDVIVAPNNCSDDTRGAALRHGAHVFDPVGPIRGKGEVLAQVADKLMAEGRYDAMCVFDADNLVHPDFLQKMNDAACAGAMAAQGFRDSKNPADTAVSTCYSVCYWMVNRFYNAGRRALGLSALINGSGFMVKLSLLRELGGWNTETMTEDYEFTAQCALAGHKVEYVCGAVIYDEQPLTFVQSWKQRRRWSTGSVQGMTLYLPALLRAAVQKKSRVCADLALTFAQPGVQAVSLLLGAATAGLAVYEVLRFALLPLLDAALWLVLACAGALLACAALAAFMVWLNRGAVARGTGRGVLYFAFFLLSWVPIGIISLVKPQKTWDAIAHTRGLALADVAGGLPPQKEITAGAARRR